MGSPSEPKNFTKGAGSKWQQRAAELAAEVPNELLTVAGIERNPTDERFYQREYPLTGAIQDLDDAFAFFLRYQHDFKDYTDKWPPYLEKFATSADEPPTGEPDPDLDVTAAIRNYATEVCGSLMCGFAKMQWQYVFKKFRNWVRFPNVVVLAIEFDHASVQKFPSLEAEQHEIGQVGEFMETLDKLGDYIRSLGYQVQIFNISAGEMLYQPFAVEAGMGQMGANGQVLSPFVGSRMGLAVLTTDAPVAFDKPMDYGITKFCEKCQICVQRCPGRALTQERIAWRGVRKFKTLTNRCYPLFVQYAGCSVCLRVCPMQKYGYEAVMDHYKQTGEVLGKGTDELEGYTLEDKGHFGPGEQPVFEEGEIILRTLPKFNQRGDHEN